VDGSIEGCGGGGGGVLMDEHETRHENIIALKTVKNSFFIFLLFF
jgi:hypothetical protein